MAASTNPVKEPNHSGTESEPSSGLVELGFLETAEPATLLSHYFPSKVGGKPAWLSFKPLPFAEKLKCGVCSQPMSFLLQIYAPLADNPSAFHRSIFVFVCRNGECSEANSARNFCVLRCQLPRLNEFYGENPLSVADVAAEDGHHEADGYSLFNGTMYNDDQSIKKVSDFSKICFICGCLGDKQCSKCKRITYCDRSHQIIHWKIGHKEECGGDGSEENKKNKEQKLLVEKINPVLFDEYELIIETECYEETKPKTERSDEERMRDFQAYVQQSSRSTNEIKNGHVEEKYDDLDQLAVNKSDKTFKKFTRRLEQNAEQVLRYDRRGEPLWAASDPRPLSEQGDVPPCPICRSSRSFEFQIMPHLLSYMDVDNLGKSLDWATVAVYTCDQSCDIPDNGYAMEFAWKQDFSE